MDAPANSVFSSSITHLLSVLCVWIKILSPATAKQDKKASGFRISLFYGSFSSDMAVKGLKKKGRTLWVGPSGPQRQKDSNTHPVRCFSGVRAKQDGE